MGIGRKEAIERCRLSHLQEKPKPSFIEDWRRPGGGPRQNPGGHQAREGETRGEGHRIWLRCWTVGNSDASFMDVFAGGCLRHLPHYCHCGAALHLEAEGIHWNKLKTWDTVDSNYFTWLINFTTFVNLRAN